MEFFVAIPDSEKVLITAFFMAAVAFGIQWLVKAAPWLAFLKNYAQEWGLMLSVVAISWLENFLPTGYEDVSIKGVAFLLALIGTFVKWAQLRGIRAFRDG